MRNESVVNTLYPMNENENVDHMATLTTLGVFLVMTKITFVPVERYFSVNTDP